MKSIIILLTALSIHPRYDLVEGKVVEAEVNGNQAVIKIGKGRTTTALQGQWRQATDEEAEDYQTPGYVDEEVPEDEVDPAGGQTGEQTPDGQTPEPTDGQFGEGNPDESRTSEQPATEGTDPATDKEL